jgi:hypothetical protein
MRKKETKKHKKQVKRVYSNLRAKAKTILKNKHKKEYFNILKKLKGGLKE